MTSLTAELDSPEEFWYDRAKSFYSLYHGNKPGYLWQARFWLNDYDYSLAEMAWDVVEMEHRNSEA